MSTSTEPDVLIVGGGPAGASVATLVRKYTPTAKVTLVEKDLFPRHHIGESLVADVNRLLSDLGAYDKIANAGFIPKQGSTFIWGRDRTPWTIEFAQLGALPGYGTGTYQTDYTWHVRRHDYDQILLDHAREYGVDVISGVSADIVLDKETRMTEVVLSDGRRLHPRFVIDATGQNNQIARKLRMLRYDPELRNVAIYGYYQDGRLDPELMGDFDMSRIGIISVDDGWMWYIPVARGLISVGVVTNKQGLARRAGQTPKQILESAIAGCPEIRPLLEGARRIQFAGAESDVLVIRDYCYTVDRVRGSGWALCGDAAGFVDPILSIGVYLSHTAASQLAYTLNTLLSGDPVDEELCWRAYEEQLQFGLQAFRRMTYMFYAFNDSKESWWWEAHRILKARAIPQGVDDKAAFLALATGYGINRPVVHEAISDFGVNIFDSFYRNLVRDESIIRKPPLKGSQPFHHRVGLRAEPWMVPLDGTGRLHRVNRVTFDEPADESPMRLFLPDAHWSFLSRLNATTPEMALRALSPDEAATVRPHVPSFVTGLLNLGALARPTG